MVALPRRRCQMLYSPSSVQSRRRTSCSSLVCGLVLKPQEDTNLRTHELLSLAHGRRKVRNQASAPAGAGLLVW
eukprot:6138475-Amphidinium_carterae.1